MLIPVEQVINFDQAKQAITTQTQVALPTKVIAKQDQKLYASYVVNGNNVIINFDSTKDCGGVKFCNIGSYSVQLDKSKFPELYKSIDGKSL